MTYASELAGDLGMSQFASLLVRHILRWLSIAALLAVAVPAHAVLLTFDNHWDGEWNTATGIINGTFVVDTLPFHLQTAVSDTNTNLADWFGSGTDSLHLLVHPDVNGPPFGGFTQFKGTFDILSGTGHYAGATGTGSYIAFAIPDPNMPGFQKIAVFDTGRINVVPEPSTNLLLLAGAATIVLALRARKK
jgi:hypothetical protein